MGVLLNLCLSTMCVPGAEKARKDVKCPGARIPDVCESSCVC